MFIHAGMQVSRSSRRGARRLRSTGLLPSCSLPMRMGRAGAAEADCFAALVIPTETFSGMFFIRAEATAQASSSRIGPWSCSLLRGAWEAEAQNSEGKQPSQLQLILFFSFQTNRGDVCSQVFPCIPTPKLERKP